MNELWSHLLIDSLVQQGVRFIVLCPGSRSTPLAIAAAEHPDVEICVHFDERGAGFIAIGYSLIAKRPAAVIVTSGTAVGNLFPAVMEASHAQIPLILLTCDRPPELRDTCANQTTDQVKLFGGFIRYAFDLPAPSKEPILETTVAQAVLSARFPEPGPVQLNCPFREPFFSDRPASKKRAFAPQISLPKLHLESREVEGWAERLGGISRGIIIAGKIPETASLGELSKRLGWPLFADITSSSRHESLHYFDALIREETEAEAILHIGRPFVSKALLQWVERQTCPLFHLSPYARRCDPLHKNSARILADPALFCSELLDHLPQKESPWLAEWQEKEKRVTTAIETCGEIEALLKMCELHTSKTALFLGNSMPVRDADAFFFPQENVGPIFANRGLSGIDGNIATCAGLAHARPVLAVIGDQTLLHDLNSLSLLKKTPHPVHLMVINNGGGGIFSFLPIAEKKELAGPFFANEHTLTFEKAAEQFHLPYIKGQNFEKLPDESCLIEVNSDRNDNVRCHRVLQERIHQCLSSSSMVS